MHFYDGTIASIRWKDRSRSESWTSKMREKARQKAIELNQKSGGIQ